MRETWRELWWKMASGKKSEYEKIKATNVFEFYQLLTLWKDQVNKENEHLKNKNKRQ